MSSLPGIRRGPHIHPLMLASFKGQGSINNVKHLFSFNPALLYRVSHNVVKSGRFYRENPAIPNKTQQGFLGKQTMGLLHAGNIWVNTINTDCMQTGDG